ncbi:poly-beta-1,6-N-acetyl-D-glucosamine synthase [Pelosinus sp. UFO1]|uniref:poly-beta-1,6-N-acetyl-D-glucosamine synthase n=1 Tax=Pelosinus sp. UFO1 TaxID=484770 RepID=UPI0004D19D09|nr:poly-beta-1,6-N-acetyl-D-glucosamine synthase [Pelosinus sp. UFO1]AIF53356.1 Poly-beta-1,6 N-acetyl-D-glucosamine synthase PgaC/IcaA [Pelosinus sp. UFO1]
MEFLGQFIFLYPIIMSIVWMIGASYFYFRYERNVPEYPDLQEFPLMTIMVPAHNEEDSIKETVHAILESDYPNFEVIVVDDGSTDKTCLMIDDIVAESPKVRSLILKQNMGKAAALNYGFLMSKGEIVVTIDADCLLDKKALHWLVWHFTKFPRVGAVTGNPRVRNRTSLLAKIQTAEYSSVIGLIKRTQRLLGKILTVSGVIAAFRRSALIDVGLWSTDMITDDIDMTWKIEKKKWDVRYETNALGWILVPETLGGLWRQRVRWAQGGIEVLRRHSDVLTSWKECRLWPLYLDYVLSVTWALTFITVSILGALGVLFGIQSAFAPYGNAIPQWTGGIIALTCLIQFSLSLFLDRKYDSNLLAVYFVVIWYPVIYWMFNSLAVIRAIPKAFLKKKGTSATWTSPDRGIRVIDGARGGNSNGNH